MTFRIREECSLVIETGRVSPQGEGQGGGHKKEEEGGDHGEQGGTGGGAAQGAAFIQDFILQCNCGITALIWNPNILAIQKN